MNRITPKEIRCHRFESEMPDVVWNYDVSVMEEINIRRTHGYSSDIAMLVMSVVQTVYKADYEKN